MTEEIRGAGRFAPARALVYLSLATGTTLATHAFAQDGNQNVGGGAASVEEVVVTGSHIRGVAPVGAPVISMGREELAASASTTVADFLKEVPQVVGVGIDETSFGSTGVNAANVARATAINLRGLSPAATLTMLDGHRVTPSGTAGAFVDASSIPSAAVQRLEVVADGASALYGSDAVAGVVNIILRKDFVGAETTARHAFADGYARTQISQLLGHNWGSGNVMFAYEFSKNDSLSSAERSFFRQDQRARGGTDWRVPNCNPGTLRVGNVQYAIPETAPGTSPSPDAFTPNTVNLCDTSLADIIPKQERQSAVLYLSQDIGERVTVSFEGFYSKKDLVSTYQAQGSASTSSVLNVPETNYYFVRPTGTTGGVQVDYSFFSQYGTLAAKGHSETYSGILEAEVHLDGDWRMRIGAVGGENYDITRSRAINPAALTAALASSDPATALNPYGLGTPQSVIDEIFTGQFSPDGRNTMSGGELRADGPLFEIAGGTVRMAAGAEWHRYTLTPTVTRGSVTEPSVVRDPPAPRTVTSGYLELYVPIVANGNAFPGVQRLDLSLAGRIDKYNDFGTTKNPKLGLTWEPIDSLTVKGSYGKSFRAPALSDLKAPGEAIQVNNLVDPTSPTGRSRGIQIRAGNRDLGPETSRTWTVGLNWHPLSLPDFQADLTYFDIVYDNQIAGVQGNPLQQEDVYGDVITRWPTAEQVAAVLALWEPNGVLPDPIEYLIDVRPQNRGTTKAGGFDLQASYGWDLPDTSRLRLSLNGTYYTRWDTQQTATAPILDKISTINNPLQYRMRGTLGWNRGAFNSSLSLNLQDSYLDDSITPNRTIDSFRTVDLALGYTFSTSWLDGLSINASVTNLLDKDPPFRDSASGYDPQQASPYGRFTSVSLTKRW